MKRGIVASVRPSDQVGGMTAIDILSLEEVYGSLSHPQWIGIRTATDMRRVGSPDQIRQCFLTRREDR